jgi:hypothetical protein
VSYDSVVVNWAEEVCPVGKGGVDMLNREEQEPLATCGICWIKEMIAEIS